jgi:hypothetical protein
MDHLMDHLISHMRTKPKTYSEKKIRTGQEFNLPYKEKEKKMTMCAHVFRWNRGSELERKESQNAIKQAM